MTVVEVADRVHDLSRMAGVAEAVAHARQECEKLRWHPALRRLMAPAAAESRVRGVAASAALEGAEIAGSRGSVAVVRDVMRGVTSNPTDTDPIWQVLTAAIRVSAAGEQVTAAALSAPAQVLARLHMAAGSTLLARDHLGRPRTATDVCAEGSELGEPPIGEELHQRLGEIAALIAAMGAGVGPTVVLSGLIHAEIVVTRPFLAGNALVARALDRVVLQIGGVDPTGVAVIEAGHHGSSSADYYGALAAYAGGTYEGVRWWLIHVADAVARGAGEGHRVADDVLAGTLPT